MYYQKSILILFLFFSVLVQGQESTAVNYRFSMPKVASTDGVNAEHYEQLEQKIKGSFSKKNIFAAQTPFPVVPYIEVVDAKNAGEVHMVKVVKIAVKLSIEDMDNQIQFNRFETTMLATDEDMPKAISKAIRQMKTSDPKFRAFFTEAEKNVMTFYTENCDKIVKTAQTHINRKKYDRAYAMLRYVPENMKCFNQVERLMTSIFNSSTEVNCREMLLKAKTEMAKKEYNQALQYVNLIDSKSSCYADVSKLLTEIGTLVNQKSIDNYRKKKLEYERKSELEKLKILGTQADYLKIPVK